MEVIFKNKTRYSKELYNKFLVFHEYKFGFKYRLTTLAVALIILFCTIINIVYANIATVFIFIIILIAYILYRYIKPLKDVQKEKKTEKIKNRKEYTFTFYDKYLVVEKGKETEKIRYLKLYKIFETKNFFYIYLNKTNALILDKNTFEIGNPKEFMKFIKKKIWFKFNIIKR